MDHEPSLGGLEVEVRAKVLHQENSF